MERILERIKDKKVIGGIIALVIIVIVTIIMILNQKNLVLKNEEIQVEFGETISLNPEDYLDMAKIDKDILDKVNISTNAPDRTELPDNSFKECPPVGEYSVMISYNDEVVEATVKVVDTTKPIFAKYKKEVGVTKDCNPDMEKIIAEFQANDLSEVKITVDDSQVDYSKVGTYKAIVKATDKYNNEATRELTFEIVEPTIELNKKSDSIYVKENVVLKATIIGKDIKAKFTSSDTGVATVDSNGKVTGKKAGSTTITAEANGVKATCKITVKKVPSGSSTEKKTVTNPNTGEKETVTVIKPKPSGGSSSGGSTSSSPTAVQSMMNRFNQARAENGISPLRWDSSLQSAAMTRAQEITQKFSHNRPDGTSALDMPGVKGEILVAGASSESAAFNAWMNSTAHRNVILNDESGGVYVVRNGSYWVGLFSY